MLGPTQDLINRCYTILARCSQFISLNNLRAVFISEELLPFRDGLQDAHSVDERVRLNVAYLLTLTTTDGRQVFTLFLQALRPSNEKDNLHGDLERLRGEFEQSFGQTDQINVPYVVAAMKQTEAAALENGEVFLDSRIAPIEHERFDMLIPYLPEDWIEDYGGQRDDWKLHADHSSVIGTVLGEMFNHINHCVRQPQNLPMINGVPFSERFFSPEQQGEAWEHLRQSGGLLIIDAISLFYPPIRQALMQSTLTSNERVAVLVLSPLNFHAAPVNSYVAELVNQEMPMTFARFAKHLDYRYEMGIGDLCGVQRWLFTLFSNPEDMARIIQKSKVDLNLERLRSQGPLPTDKISEVIFRQSEVGQ